MYVISNDVVDLAVATGISTAAIGIVISKPTTTTANVLYNGEVDGFTGLVAGDPYYLSETAGQITSVAPSATGHVVQIIGTAKDDTTLMVEIDGSFVLL